MADAPTPAPLENEAPLSWRKKLALGSGLFVSVTLVAGLFFYGHTTLTAPSTAEISKLQARLAAINSSDNISDNMSDLAATDEMMLASNEADAEAAEEEGVDMDGDGIVDFNGPDYRYYQFETPFLSNLKDSKKLLTIELALLIKRPALFVDGELSKLIDFSPALRSQILSFLVTQSPDQLKSRGDRMRLAKELRTMLNQYLGADSSVEEEGILEVHIVKMVVA